MGRERKYATSVVCAQRVVPSGIFYDYAQWECSRGDGRDILCLHGNKVLRMPTQDLLF